MSTRTVSISGEGSVPLFPLERTAPYLFIYISAVEIPNTRAFNFRYPLARTFFGYIQLFDDQAVIKTCPIEYQCQRVWENIDTVQLIFYRICQLGDYIRDLNTGLGAGFSASFASFGVSLSPSFPDAFPGYAGILITKNPEYISYSLEPNVAAVITINAEQLPAGDCFANVGQPDAPGGCGGVGTLAPNMPQNCLPQPGGGSGS